MTRNALSKLFMTGNQAIQKFKKIILHPASSLNEPLELYHQTNCKG
jgi:hypothetical protein